MPDWKDTLNLPNTGFRMKANLPAREPEMHAHWENSDLYGQIRKQQCGKQRYILHDGPPYANGRIHLGHALNKILKDFIVKSRTMAGFDAPYVPGWDCHGLPIELQVDRQLGKKKREMSTADIRRACRDYAIKHVDLMRGEFKRLGVLGNWDMPIKQLSFEFLGTSLNKDLFTEARSLFIGVSVVALLLPKLKLSMTCIVHRLSMLSFP